VALTRPRRGAALHRDRSEGASFDALLSALHPDRETAAERYQAIRERVQRFFAWRGARWPDELADETIDRVARRLAGGEIIRTADVARYFLGVARNVLREAWQRDKVHGGEHDVNDLAEPTPVSGPDEDAHVECLERCLEELGADSRDLLLRYYQGDGMAKIEGRRALAAQLGLPSGTLRIRLHRLRARLESCVRKCLSARETPSPAQPPSGGGTHRQP
jgi:DNA-directed RNA polymerase specialized sigma24 family protein